MVRVELGVVSKGKLTFTELLCEYLRHEQFDQVSMFINNTLIHTLYINIYIIYIIIIIVILQ